MPLCSYQIELATRKAVAVARSVLDSLPEWFGQLNPKESYIAAAARLPTFVAYAPDGRAVGFLSLEQHTPVTMEVHVIGVLSSERGKGCGRALLATAEQHAKKAGMHWLTVKTLAASHPDLHYAATRRFYEAGGFEPLEVFPTLWGAETPCLFMAKAIA